MARSESALQPGQKLLVSRHAGPSSSVTSTSAPPHPGGTGLMGAALHHRGLVLGAGLGGALLAAGLVRAALTARSAATTTQPPADSALPWAAGRSAAVPWAPAEAANLAPSVQEPAAALSLGAAAPAAAAAARPPSAVLSAVSTVRTLLQDAAVEMHAVESALAAVRHAASTAPPSTAATAAAAAAASSVVLSPTAAAATELAPAEATPPPPAAAWENPAMADDPPRAAPTAAAVAGGDGGGGSAAADTTVAGAAGSPTAAAPVTSPAVEGTTASPDPGPATSAAAAGLAGDAASPPDASMPLTDASATAETPAAASVPAAAAAAAGVETTPWAAFSALDAAAQVAAARARVQSAMDAAYGLMLAVPIQPPDTASTASATTSGGGGGAAELLDAPTEVVMAAASTATAAALEAAASPAAAVMATGLGAASGAPAEAQAAAGEAAVPAVLEPPAEVAPGEAPPPVTLTSEVLPVVVAEALTEAAAAAAGSLDSVSAGQVLDRIREINKLLEEEQQRAADVPPAAMDTAEAEAATASPLSSADLESPPPTATAAATGAGAEAAALAPAPAASGPGPAPAVLFVPEGLVEYEQPSAADVAADRQRAAALLGRVDVLLASFESLSPEQEALLQQVRDKVEAAREAAQQEEEEAAREAAAAEVQQQEEEAAREAEAASAAAAAPEAAAAVSAPAAAATGSAEELLLPPPLEPLPPVDMTALSSVDSTTTSRLVLKLPAVGITANSGPLGGSPPEAPAGVTAEATPMSPQASDAAATAPAAAAAAVAPSPTLLAAGALAEMVRPLGGAAVAGQVLDRIRDIGKLLEEAPQRTQAPGSSDDDGDGAAAPGPTAPAVTPPAVGSSTAALDGPTAEEPPSPTPSSDPWASSQRSPTDTVEDGRVRDGRFDAGGFGAFAAAAGAAGVPAAVLESLRRAMAQPSPAATPMLDRPKGADPRVALPPARAAAGMLNAPPKRIALPPAPELAAPALLTELEPLTESLTEWLATETARRQPQMDMPAAGAADSTLTDALQQLPAPAADDVSSPAASPADSVAVERAAAAAAAALASIERLSASPIPSAAPPPPPPAAAVPAPPQPSSPPPPPPPQPPSPPTHPKLATNPVLQRAVAAAASAASANPATADPHQPSPRSHTGEGRRPGGGGAVQDDDATALVHLKSGLLDLVYGTARGVSATPVQRAAIDEFVCALEGRNPNTHATDAVSALAGRWKLVYTSNVATLLLLGALDGMPLVDVGDVYQAIDAETMTATNKIDLAVPMPLSLRAEAGLEVRSPRQFKVRFTRVGLDTYVATPQLVAALEVPHSVTVLGATLDLTPLRRLLEPLNSGLEAAQSLIGRAVAPEVDVGSVPVPPGLTRGSVSEAASLWMLTTYLDDNLRISRDDEGRVFVMLKDVGIYPEDVRAGGRPSPR